MRKSSHFMSNPSKINQSGAQERSKSDLGSKSVPGYEKRRHIFLEIWDFWRHWDDFGRHLVPSWAPRGSQNREFWHQDAPKSQKMTSRMRHQKKYDFLIGFVSENVRFWMCWTHRNALYISIWVVLAYEDKIKNFTTNPWQNGRRSDNKFEILALWS